MRCSWVSIQGSKAQNEDALVCQPEQALYGVIDGATAVVPYVGSRGESSGFLAAHLIADSFMQNGRQRANGSLPLDALFRQANADLRAAMVTAKIDLARPEQLWGACAVLVRLGQDHIEVAQIGDAVLALLYNDSSITLATPNQLAAVSRITRGRCREAAERDFASLSERHAFIRQGLLTNRQLANRPGGYGVLNGQVEAEYFIVSRRIPLHNVKALLLMTDGLAFPGAESDDELGVDEVVKHVQRMGLAAYVNWLLGVEQEDSACRRFPRVKVSDDKTAIELVQA